MELRLKSPIIHHVRWRSPKYLITCGIKNGFIHPRGEVKVTCKNCIRVVKARGWRMHANAQMEKDWHDLGHSLEELE